MAGASGAATSTAQLQAYAGGGSGLTKGEPYIKSYGFNLGLRASAWTGRLLRYRTTDPTFL